MRNVIAAVIAIVVYWIKTTLDKHAKEIKSTLININNNISTTQTVNIHHYAPVDPSTTFETAADEDET